MADQSQSEVESQDTEVNNNLSADEKPKKPASRIKKRDVFIGNLSLYTTEEKLKAYFARFGPVEDVRIMYHPETKRSRRFGFVTFCEEEAVDSALKVRSTHHLDGKCLDVKHAFKRSDEEGGLPPVKKMSRMITSGHSSHHSWKSQDPQIKVFIGGIAPDATDNDLKEYFTKYGALKTCNLLADKVTGRNRGFAFITFEDDRCADLACYEQFHYINGKRVEVKRALPKSSQSRALAVLPPNAGTWPGLMTAPPSLMESQYPIYLPSTAAQAAYAANPEHIKRFTPYGFGPGRISATGNHLIVGRHQQISSMQQNHLYPLQALIQAAQSSPLLSALIPNPAAAATQPSTATEAAAAAPGVTPTYDPATLAMYQASYHHQYH